MEEDIKMGLLKKMKIKFHGFIPIGMLPPKNILEVIKKNK